MKKLLLGLVVSMVVAAPALAGRVEAGLWEAAITRHSPELDARAKLQPAISEKARAVMKAQGLEINGATVKSRVCITKELANLDHLPIGQSKDCKVLKSAFVGNTLVADVACNIMGRSSHTHSEITYENSHHYFGTVTTDSTMNGQSHHGSIEIDGRYVGPDCGTASVMVH